MISISLCFLQQQLDLKVLNLTASWGDPINHMIFLVFNKEMSHRSCKPIVKIWLLCAAKLVIFGKPDPDNWFATSAWRCFCWKPKESFTACSIVSQIPMIWDPTAWQSGEHALEAREYTWTYSRSQSWPWWHLVACVLLPAARCLLPTACWLLPAATASQGAPYPPNVLLPAACCRRLLSAAYADLRWPLKAWLGLSTLTTFNVSLKGGKKHQHSHEFWLLRANLKKRSITHNFWEIENLAKKHVNR